MDLGIWGRTALVCASSRGLGRGVAEALAAEGARLMLCARDAAALEETAQDLRKTHGAEVHTRVTDLTRSDDVEALAQDATRRLGHVDILVNNTGGPPKSSPSGTTAAQWQEGFERLFLSATALASLLLPGMRARKFGRVVTITSLVAVEPSVMLPVSSAMRAGITAWNKALATEVAPDGVTAHTVMPGLLDTERVRALYGPGAAQKGIPLAEEMALQARAIPMGRLGTPAEFGAVVAFLCSAKASYVTGLCVPVDGGSRKSV